MATLLLRLAGPLQSWGSVSKLDVRTTGSEPTKSGVIGMIASAMGRSRTDSVSDLASLRFGVRIDQAGSTIRDFHTAHGSDSYVTDRYYLADAVFAVGLEGDRELLESIVKALRYPFHPLSLGRRSCIPVGRIVFGLFDTPLIDVLKNSSWMASEWYMRKQPRKVSLEVIYDSAADTKGVLMKDVPISFAENDRRYVYRDVTREVNGAVIENRLTSETVSEPSTTHDPFATIRGD